MDYLYLSLLWIAWCSLHSILISQHFTRVAEQLTGNAFRYYRLCYNIFSAATLLLPLWFGWHLEGAPLFRLDGIITPIRFFLLVVAFYLFAAGIRKYDMSRFIGIFQATTGKQQKSIAINDELDTSGIHQITRHPWYTAGILLIWSYQSKYDLQSLITNTIITLYFIIGAILEERKLIAIFGHQYHRYQQEVSIFLPWKWLKQSLKKRL